MGPPVLFATILRTLSVPGFTRRLVTTSSPPPACTGPTVAVQPPAGIATTANPPSPVNPGGAHKGGEGEVSVTVQIEPTVVVTIPDPGVGSVVMTVVGPVGPPGPVHDTLNVYVPGITGVPVVF